MPFNIVLVHPQIPNNTGNIGRLCVATQSILHLIQPLGFELSDKYLKRAGLDYWQHLEYHVYESFEDFLSKHGQESLSFFTKKAETSFWNHSFEEDSYLVFGREADGLPDDLLQSYQNQALQIPLMSNKVRSLNLANAVSIALYEAIRQRSTET